MVTGIVAGSFDPITNGHTWLIRKAVDLVDELTVVVGVNPSKKYTFDMADRMVMVRQVLENSLTVEQYNKIIVAAHDGFLVHKAADIGAKYIFRGIRSEIDFIYEQQIQQVNRKMDANVETVFFIPPPEYMEVSSSTVKSLVGFDGWEAIVAQYVDPIVVKALRDKK